MCHIRIFTVHCTTAPDLAPSLFYLSVKATSTSRADGMSWTFSWTFTIYQIHRRSKQILKQVIARGLISGDPSTTYYKFWAKTSCPWDLPVEKLPGRTLLLSHTQAVAGLENLMTAVCWHLCLNSAIWVMLLVLTICVSSHDLCHWGKILWR